jgi:hypothetical protein
VARRFLCPLLHGEVELTGERERHIEEVHPERSSRMAFVTAAA